MSDPDVAKVLELEKTIRALREIVAHHQRDAAEWKQRYHDLLALHTDHALDRFEHSCNQHPEAL